MSSPGPFCDILLNRLEISLETTKETQCARNGRNAMPFVPFFDTVQAVIGFDVAGAKWSTAMYFTLANLDSAKAQVLGGEIDLYFVTPLLDSLVTSCEFTDIVLYDMSSDESPRYTYTPAVAKFGASGAASVPLHTCLVATSYSDTRGRSGRGRNYITGFDESRCGPTVWNPATVSEVDNVFEVWQASPLSNGAEWVIASRYSNNVQLNIGRTFPVTSTNVRNNRIATQRRRVGKY